MVLYPGEFALLLRAGLGCKACMCWYVVVVVYMSIQYAL